MESYAKRRMPVGFVKLDEVLSEGTPITIRTLKGDIDMTVERDLYCMIGTKGEVQPLEGKKFQKKYQILEGENNLGEYLERLEYVPVIKNRDTGRDMRLTDYARMCVPGEESLIYARTLERGVKVFASHDKSRYMLGEPGDYLAVSREDTSDVYVVEKGLFGELYTAL